VKRHPLPHPEAPIIKAHFWLLFFFLYLFNETDEKTSDITATTTAVHPFLSLVICLAVVCGVVLGDGFRSKTMNSDTTDSNTYHLRYGPYLSKLSYHPNTGHLKEAVTVRSETGQPHGMRVDFFEDGRIKTFEIFDEGVRVGEKFVWRQDGEKHFVCERIFFHGDGKGKTVTAFNPDGTQTDLTVGLDFPRHHPHYEESVHLHNCNWRCCNGAKYVDDINLLFASPTRRLHRVHRMHVTASGRECVVFVDYYKTGHVLSLGMQLDDEDFGFAPIFSSDGKPWLLKSGGYGKKEVSERREYSTDKGKHHLAQCELIDAEGKYICAEQYAPDGRVIWKWAH